MENFSKQVLDKPNNLKDKDFVAIVGIYDTPKTVYEIGKQPYHKSELAFNENTGKVQVYIAADKISGLNQFKQDYPDAEIRENATLENPEDWRVIAFSSQLMPDESTPLDNYFQARGRELATIQNAKLITKEKK